LMRRPMPIRFSTSHEFFFFAFPANIFRKRRFLNG
jgi:hypothetical protein